MADQNIDNLYINVEVGGNADEKLDEIYKNLENIEDGVNDVEKAFESFANVSKIDVLRKKISNVNKGLNEAASKNKGLEDKGVLNDLTKRFSLNDKLAKEEAKVAQVTAETEAEWAAVLEKVSTEEGRLALKIEQVTKATLEQRAQGKLTDEQLTSRAEKVTKLTNKLEELRMATKQDALQALEWQIPDMSLGDEQRANLEKILATAEGGSNAFDGIGESAKKAAVDVEYLFSSAAKTDYLENELLKAQTALKKLADGGNGYENKDVRSLINQINKLETELNRITLDNIKKQAQDLETIDLNDFATPIQQSADKAAVSIDYLMSKQGKLDGLQNELAQAYTKLLELTQGGAGYENKDVKALTSQIERLKKQIDSLNGANQNVTKSTNNYNKGLRGLLGTAKQFLIFGTFFTIQRQISEAFKVGTQNAYQYSKALGGDFANSMDRLATSSQYLRNSIGAWSSSLINAFAPVLEILIDKLAAAGNALARFFAALSGQKTVLQAKKSMREYAAATDKATKSTQKSLAAFDEINNISSGSSGANVAAGSQDYGSMFETVELDSTSDAFAKWGKRIREVTEDLGGFKTIALVTLGVLGGFFIIKKLVSLFTGFGGATKTVGTGFSNFLTSVGKGVEAIAILGGLAIVINSVTKLIDTFAESGLTLGEVAGLLGISLGTVAGAFIAIAAALKFLQPSWQSIAGAIVIFGGLILVVESVTKLLKTLGDIGMSTGQIFGQMGAVLMLVVGIVAALTAASMILATNPLAMLGVVAVAGSLWLVLNALGKALPPIINSFSNLAKNVAPYVIQAMEIIRYTIADIPYFITRLGTAIENFVDSAIRSITKLINFLISGIEYTINTLVIDSINGFLKGLNKIPGVDFDLLADVKIRRFKPKLFANGGYPASGEMFIARENGIPEMVGSIGGRTAVANNDQIVEAISIGVYNAYMDAMSRSGGNKQPTIVQINGREVFRAVQDESTSYRKRTGQPAF